MSKKKVIGWVLFIAWFGFILWMTLLSRKPLSVRSYNLTPFWSYRKLFDFTDPQWEQVLDNILFFIPYGVLMPLCVNGNKREKFLITIISACSFSIMIEITQFLLKLGFSEFDDVFDNTLGAFIGATVVLTVTKFINKRIKKNV